MTLRNTLTSLAGCLLATTLITACGDDNEIPIIQEPELNGRFSNQDCNGIGVGEAGVSYRETLRFEVPDKFTRYQDLYTNADCSGNPEGTAEAQGTFNVDNDGAPDSDGGAMELKMEKAFVTAQTEGMATALSLVNYCGVAEYKAGEEKEVSPQDTDNLTCIVQDVPNTLYGVYTLDGDTLYLNEGGVGQMGESKEDRPKGLDKGTAYQKQ